jgi:hypothetical protein
VPVPFLLVAASSLVGVGGLVAWCGLVLPMGLRDVWRRAGDRRGR